MEEDKSFKYVMMDTSFIYLGARFTYGQLLEEDMVPFKLKALISHYILKETDPDTTLESQLYYLEPGNFLFDTLMQLKVKVKVNVLIDKKSITGKVTRKYNEKILDMKELTGMNLAKKKGQGLIVREMIVSRLALMAFSV